MASDSEDSMKFVRLIEEHQDVLIKSQKSDQKKKKAEAVLKIIPKWAEISGKTLTPITLFKKINNYKSRAKLVLSAGHALNDWQSKLLEIVGPDIGADVAEMPNKDQDEMNSTLTTSLSGKITEDSTYSKEINKPQSDAEQLLSVYETEETKLLNTEQLQRFLLLKQVRLVEQHQQRLERLEGIGNAVNSKDIVFDFVNFDGAAGQ